MPKRVAKHIQKFKNIGVHVKYLEFISFPIATQSGETAVVTSVNGPIDVKSQHMNVEKTHRHLYFILRNEQRKLRTDISVQMQDLGGLVACAINAVCLALMNSGIEMKYLVAAVHSSLREDGEIFLDPDALQSEDARAKFTFVFSIYTHGKFTMEQNHRALQRMAKVFDFYGKIVGKQREVL